MVEVRVEALDEAVRAIEATREEVARDAEAALAAARSPLGDADPLGLGWCPFELAGATGETSFTQWLAGLLRLPGEVGGRAWRALAEVVRTRASATGEAIDEAALASLVAPETVYDERPEQVVGEDGTTHNVRPDIIIEDDRRFVVLELKLTGDWNTLSETENQATLYRRLAEAKANGRAIALVNLAIDARPADGWVAITWSALGLRLREELADLLEKERSIPAHAFPLLALAAGIERTLLELAPRTGDTRWQAYRRHHDALAHLEPTAGANPMSTPVFDHVAKQVALRFDTLRPAYDEFESRRIDLTNAFLGLALRGAPPPEVQKTERGTMLGAYWTTPYSAAVKESGARGQRAGFWLGFCSGSDYAVASDPLAADLVFRGDLWFPLPYSGRERVKAAARSLAGGSQELMEEGTYVLVPVFRLRAVDATVEQLERHSRDIYGSFQEVSAALLRALEAE